MAILTGQSCWALVALRLCLNIILQTCSLSPSQREPFLRSAALRQDVILDRRVFSLPQIIFILCLPLKLCNWIQNLNDNKVKLSEHFICLILVCDVFYVITSVMTLVMILVRTNHHCLKVGRHICSNEARALLKNIRQLTNIMYDWRKGREEKTRLWFTLLVAYQLIFLFYFYVLYSFS
jgi:hypothetical protein